MTTSSASNATDEQNKKQADDDEHHEILRQVGWKAIFSFTTRKHLPVLFAACFFGFFAAITLPAMAVIFGLIFRQFSDFAAGKISGPTLLHKASDYCIYLTAICAFNWFTNSLYFALFLAFSELQARSARDKIFRALLRKDIEWYDTRESGIAAFLPAVQSQIRDLQLSTSVPLGELVQCTVMGLGALGVAFFFSWNLTLVIICTVPLVYLILAFLSGRLSKRAHEQADKLQQALTHATNAIQNIEIVKCFNGERYEYKRYVGAVAQAGRLYKRQASIRSTQIGFMQFVTLSIFFQGFWYGSYLVTSGKKNPAEVVTTFWASLMAVQAITEFMPQFIILQKGKVAGVRLRTVMEQISKNDHSLDSTGCEKPSRFVGDIEFNKVSFSYPTRPDQLALKEETMFFPAGETTFVVGRSGSGKSTLGQLLMRLYHPRAGQIYIDGVPLKRLDARWLRENVTLVEQNSVLFNDTIRQNIAFGRKDEPVADRELEEATTFAFLQQLVHYLPNGFETLVGTKGNSMSGGQRQRIALARARLRDTPILVLDESTSALDCITRSAVLEAIRAWRKGKTTIIITHDITQILPDNYVYMLDQAQVVQEGFRGEMEVEVGSAFHTLLNSELLEQPEEDNDLSDDGTDEIMSLYADSWAEQSLLARDVPFEDPFLSPFFSPGRSSMYMNTVFTGRRPSIPYSEPGRVTPTLGRSSPGPLKHPPHSASSGMQQRSRCGSRSASPRPLPRDASRQPSRPTSLLWDAPVRLDIEASPLSSRRLSLRKIRRRSRPEAQDEPEFSIPSLSILQVLRTFWPALSWESRIALVGAIFCASLHAAATPIFGFAFAQLLSTFYAAGDQYELALKYALTILGIAIGDGLSTFGFHFLFDACAQNWANALKAEAMRRILMQPREFFDREENSLSRLAECLDNFAEEARNLPGRFVGIGTVVVFMISIAVIWSFVTCWKLTLVALGSVPVLYAIMSCYNAISSRWERLSNEADENVGQVLHETFVNIRTVRCLVLEEVFRKKFKKTTVEALKTGLKRAVYTGSIFGINYSGVFFVATLCFWFGAYIVSMKEFATTAIIQTFTILLLSMNHVSYIVNYIPQINIARDAGSRLIRLARLPQTSHEHKGTVQLGLAGDIAFRDLSFSYPLRRDHPVLQGINFSIPRGRCTAIVGSSGSGKSTIAALLLKLYQTDPLISGDLTISNHEINTLHTAILRSRIAIVSQTPVIFPGTVSENIVYGLSPSSSRASPNNIRTAVCAAGIDEFINSLPQGYQTVVGEGGSGLSGGQAQRVAIARALIREPDILILDEATSALDVESAGIIRDTIQRLVGEVKRSMTVIIITHAREMMAIAEHIIMLDKGRVVEQGTFDELRRRRGPFTRLLRG